MNTGSTKANWFPYTIPATPNVSAKSFGGTLTASDPYVISAASGAVSTQNPSKHLEWNQLPINDILSKLNTLQQDVNAIKSRLNNASITADCSSGDIVVTLNL